MKLQKLIFIILSLLFGIVELSAMPSYYVVPSFNATRFTDEISSDLRVKSIVLTQTETIIELEGTPTPAEIKKFQKSLAHPSYHNLNDMIINQDDGKITGVKLYYPRIQEGLYLFYIKYNTRQGSRSLFKISLINTSDNIGLDEGGIKSKILESTDPITGIYQIEGKKYGLIYMYSKYFLVYLDKFTEYWRSGDVKAVLQKTAVNGLLVPEMWYNDYDHSLNDGWGHRNHKIYIYSGNVLLTYETFRNFRWNPTEETGYKLFPTDSDYATRTPSAQSRPQEWSGSGFALRNGYIVTNSHVVDDAKDVRIYGINGNFSYGYQAQLVGNDAANDLALLKITDSNFQGFPVPPYSCRFSMAEVGENVFALGYPLTGTMGEEVKLTNGIISSRTGYDGNVSLYQISVPIQPGNSGGPLFDKNGNIVGIICAKHLGAENASYAIKMTCLKNLVESITSESIFPTNNSIVGMELKDQVKRINNYVYLIKCSSK